MKAGERAVALKPGNAEYYRVLGTLYGQGITDIMSGLSYGPKAKEAIIIVAGLLRLVARRESRSVSRLIGCELAKMENLSGATVRTMRTGIRMGRNCSPSLTVSSLI